MADGYARTSDDDELLSDADDASSSASHEKCSEGQGGKVAQSKHRVKGLRLFTLLSFFPAENTAMYIYSGLIFLAGYIYCCTAE